MKIVIYTALFGNHDELAEPRKKIIDADLVCITNNANLTSQNFEIMPITTKLSNGHAARFCKMSPHLLFPNYDYSIWIDARLELKFESAKKIVERYLDDGNSFAIFKHSSRTNINQELLECSIRSKDDIATMYRQVKYYEEEGLPKDHSLAETGMIIRDHHDVNVNKFCESWFKEIYKYSIRDQLSFPYAVYKHNFKYRHIDGYVTDNRFFKWLQRK